RRRLHEAAADRVGRGEGDGMQDAVEATPLAVDLPGQTGQVLLRVDVELQHVGRLGQAGGGALGHPAGAAEAGQQDLGTGELGLPRDGEGDALPGEDARDQESLAGEHQASSLPSWIGESSSEDVDPSAAPDSAAGSRRHITTISMRATRSSAWVTIRTASVTSPVSAPSSRLSSSRARTRIVSPSPTGRFSTAPSMERNASTTRGSIGRRPSA